MKRRSLGQHYLVDPKVIRRIVELAEIRPTDRVLEIGTGKGALTRELAGLGAGFDGYEVDRRNYEETLAAVREKEVNINLGDAFEQRPSFDVLVSSLPYSESARFIGWLGAADFERAIVVLQEDFVRKITARPGARDYRGISALAQIAFDIRVQEKVNRKSFSPQPRVNSVIVLLTPKALVSEAEAANVMRLFSLRRRQVDSALTELGMEGAGDHGQRRVYSLTPEQVHELCCSPGQPRGLYHPSIKDACVTSRSLSHTGSTEGSSQRRPSR
ncbi:MAG TPA: rRNA adenine dimethyltransferase family protein [Nitrososphaerales archaeon]|nr:rRNA adenine dimethyltransferase family protein [Nitrososphaerales archaeon]